MRTFVTACCAALGLAASASAQTLVPAAGGNRWVLNNIYNSQAVTVSVTSTKVYGPKTVTELKYAFPWAEYSLLVSQNAEGMWMEGILFGGNTYWLDTPEALYKTNVAAGSSWPTLLGQVTLTSKTATVTAGSTTHTGVHTYTLGGNSQIWAFKPGYGIVSYTINGIEFKVSSAITNAYATSTAPLRSRTCPTAGVTAIPEDGTISSANREGILQTAMNAGSKNLIVGASWQELEPTEGTYNLARISAELGLASKYKLSTVFSLRVPQTAAAALPPYLAGRSLDDPYLITRLNALLTRIAAILPTQVKWFNLGYEVDTFTFTNPAQLNAYKTMFSQGRTTIRTLKTGMSVGQVFSFDSSRANNEMYRNIFPAADHVAFTYYGLKGHYGQRDPNSPAADIPLMLAMAGSKPVLLVETGYSSAWSGQATQAQFLSSVMTALRSNSGRIPLFSVWSYRDIPATQLPMLAMQFGQTSAEFNQFITSTGLVTETNTPKLAWSTFTTAAPGFTGTSCLGQ